MSTIYCEGSSVREKILLGTRTALVVRRPHLMAPKPYDIPTCRNIEFEKYYTKNIKSITHTPVLYPYLLLLW